MARLVPRLARRPGQLPPPPRRLRAGLYSSRAEGRSLCADSCRAGSGDSKSTDYSYDRPGRLLNVNDFKGDDTDLEHAPFCSNSNVKTPRGIHRKSVFDGLCRMTQVETQEERHLFDYDELDRLVRATVGERYAHTPPGQSRQGGRYAKTVLKYNTDYVYDENDRVSEIRYPNGDTVAYTYDDEGNVLTVNDVHGKTTTYTYYRDGRLKTVSYAGQTFSYSYDAAGRLSQIDYPSSTNVVASFTKTDTTTGWDPNGQLLSVRYLKSGTEFQRFVYSYDNSGNRKTMDEVRTLSGTPLTVNWAYTYDGFNRLAQVYKNSNLVSVYTYDESDNRTLIDWPQSSEVWKMSYDIADRLEKREYKVGAGAFSDYETYAHDVDGNMTSRTLVATSTTVSYDWNSHNRLRQVRENGAHKESTSFDHGGIRRLKADGGGNTKYFSSAGMSLADTRPSGPVSFIQGHQLLGLEESNNLYYFVTDGLASVRLVLDGSGNIQGELRYNEWGVPEAAVSPLSAPAAGLSGHSYTGGLGVRNDGASLGLYYARQRFFDPTLARWLTPDPIGFAGGLNLYTAMDNDPVGRVDPEGLDGEGWDYDWYPSRESGWKAPKLSANARAAYRQQTAQLQAADWMRRASGAVNDCSIDVVSSAVPVHIPHLPLPFGPAKRGLVVLDSNAIDAVLAPQGGRLLRGRIPVVPVTAAKEFLRGPGTSNQLRNMLVDNGGRLGRAGSEATVRQLQSRARSLGRALKTSDARVAACAMREKAPIMTWDVRFANFLRAIKYQVEP